MDSISGPVNGPINLIERQKLILQMFAEGKSLSIGKLCEKTGLSMVRLDSLLGGRVSLALPRAILRMTAEKAGAGMCRLGLGQGGNPVYVHSFASSATEVFQRFTILMRSDASLRKFQTTWRVTKER